MTSANEANGWYGGTLLGDQDESSEIYKHYAELCQVRTFTLVCPGHFESQDCSVNHYLLTIACLK